MRLIRYINEESISKKLLQDFYNQVDNIRKECQPYFKKVKGSSHLLIRYGGKENEKNDILKKKVRINRRPKDTSIVFHKMADDFFLKKFGWRARSNVLFCMGEDRERIHEISYFTLIFPVGNFKYVWSPDVADLYTFDPDNEDYDGDWDDVKDTYIDKDFNKALKTQYEIMINCKEYYAIPPIFLYNMIEEFNL